MFIPPTTGDAAARLAKETKTNARIFGGLTIFVACGIPLLFVLRAHVVLLLVVVFLTGFCAWLTVQCFRRYRALQKEASAILSQEK